MLHNFSVRVVAVDPQLQTEVTHRWQGVARHAQAALAAALYELNFAADSVADVTILRQERVQDRAARVAAAVDAGLDAMADREARQAGSGLCGVVGCRGCSECAGA